MNTDNYLEINRNSWNNKLEAHMNSSFYNLKGFINGATSLNDVELKLLGDVKGKSVLHLQCHFGQDSISLSRMGADVTGVDLSDRAIDSAKKLAQQLNSLTEFICCDVYDLENHLNKKFDIVFSSYGTIGWLPDMNRWAGIVSNFLKPNGKLVFVEFHPVVWMFNDSFDKIAYHYFNVEPIVEKENGTYADKEANITQTTVSWNHDLGEVIGGLINNAMEILDFREYDYSPYNVFKDMNEDEPKKYRLKNLDYKIPMLYSIVAQRK